MTIAEQTTVAISGHFDPFHDMHLNYIRQALLYGDKLVCIVSSDKQLVMKKDRVNIPEAGRLEIVSLILKGLNVGTAVLNTFDTETTLVANALRKLRPDVFCRGGDKSPEDFPKSEKSVCDQYAIEVVYAHLQENRHGSEMTL